MLYKAVSEDVTWENIVSIAEDFNKLYEVFLKADKERDLDDFKDFIYDNIYHNVFRNMVPSGSSNEKTTIVDIKGKKIQLAKWGVNPFSKGSPFRTWFQLNFPLEQDASRFSSMRAYYAALENLRNLTFGLMDVKKVKRAFHGVIETMKDLTNAISALFADLYPKNFTYKGFNIRNTDRLSRYVVNNMLEGIEVLVEIFKKRAMTHALQDGLRFVVLRFARKFDGNAAATYSHDFRNITMLQWTLNPREDGHYENWIVETFIHEFGHYIHQAYLSKDAKQVWDEGWTGVEKAKYQDMVENRPVVINKEDRDNYYDWWKAKRYDFKAVAFDMEEGSPDQIKYMGWLALDDIGLSYDPNAVVLTPFAKQMSKFFRTPKAEWLEEFKNSKKDDPLYGEDFLVDFAEQEYTKKRNSYFDALRFGGPKSYSTQYLPKEPSANRTNRADEALAELGLPTPYAGTNLKEDFAETFVMFLLKPERLSKIARYRMERALSLSGLYGKPVMQLAKVAANLVLQGHVNFACELLQGARCPNG